MSQTFEAEAEEHRLTSMVIEYRLKEQRLFPCLCRYEYRACTMWRYWQRLQTVITQVEHKANAVRQRTLLFDDTSDR